MAKALFGHVGIAADPRPANEVRRLRDRVALLEREVARLRADNAALSAAKPLDDEMIALALTDAVSEREPALT
jgi:uncharacterized small protein (DUF1192 family)